MTEEMTTRMMILPMTGMMTTTTMMTARMMMMMMMPRRPQARLLRLLEAVVPDLTPSPVLPCRLSLAPPHLQLPTPTLDQEPMLWPPVYQQRALLLCLQALQVAARTTNLVAR